MSEETENTVEEKDPKRRGKGRIKKLPAYVLEDDFVFDYKDPGQLKHFISDRGKIHPRRVTGLNAKQQRELTLAVNRARNLALLPYTVMR